MTENKKKEMKLWKKVVIGMILGIAMGMLFPSQAIYLKYVGMAFIKVLKMVVAPLIFFSVLNGITNINDANTFERLGFRAFAMYMSTTIFAVSIGLAFATYFKPGVGINIDLNYSSNHYSNDISIPDMLLAMIPESPIKAMAESNTLQIVIFAFFTGFALILVGEKGREVKSFITSCTHLIFKMISLIIKLTPYGVFAMMAWVVSEYGVEVILKLWKFATIVISALLVQYMLYGIILLALGRVNPIPFYKKMITTQTLAFATASSKATLATAMSEIRNKMGVSKDTSSFILPLGAAINMDGMSIYLGICAVFFAQIIGIELNMMHYMILILTCTIGSIGGAGFPGGSILMMGMVLSSVGLPLEGISLILGIDKFLEMLRTMINITGDCTVTLIVDKMEGTFSKKVYYSKEKK